MKSGFAGSLVVSAGWRGRNLRRGMQDSQKRVNNFGKGIRRIVAATALGVGAFAAGKGLASLLKMSSAGAKAISKWSIAWAKFKQQVARLIAGPAARVINWLATGLGIITDWLSKQTSITGAFRNLVQLAKNFLANSVLIQKALSLWHGFIQASAIMIRTLVTAAKELGYKVLKEWWRLVKLVMTKMLDWSLKLFNIWQQIMAAIANATASIASFMGSFSANIGFSGSAAPRSGVQSASQQLMAGGST